MSHQQSEATSCRAGTTQVGFEQLAACERVTFEPILPPFPAQSIVTSVNTRGALDVGLALLLRRKHSEGVEMNGKPNESRHRVELGRHIVADSRICGGQPTFKKTRIMVWVVLEQLDRGLTWAEIVREWDGKVPEAAIGEAIAIADLVVKHEPFRGFNVGPGRKPTRRATALAA